MYMLAYCSMNKVVHAGARVSMHTCITGSTSNQESAQQYYSGYTVLLSVYVIQLQMDQSRLSS